MHAADELDPGVLSEHIVDAFGAEDLGRGARQSLNVNDPALASKVLYQLLGHHLAHVPVVW